MSELCQRGVGRRGGASSSGPMDQRRGLVQPVCVSGDRARQPDDEGSQLGEFVLPTPCSHVWFNSDEASAAMNSTPMPISRPLRMYRPDAPGFRSAGRPPRGRIGERPGYVRECRGRRGGVSVFRSACHVVVTLIGLLVGPRLAGGEPGVAVPEPRGMAALRPIINDSFRFKETDHFLIAYDTSYDALRPLVGRLEGIHDAIRAFVLRSGIGGDVEFGKLPVVLFDGFDDFTRYAEEAGVSGSMVGFYHHGTNVAAFCNTAHHPEMQRITTRIENARARVKRIGAGGSGSPSSAKQRQDLQRMIATWQARSDAVTQTFNRFVIQHEAAHQILFNLGVHVRGADNPLWLVEGLACQFEVPQAGHGGVLKRVNHMRLADFRDALRVRSGDTDVSDVALRSAVAERRFLPLVELIADPQAFATSGSNAIYHYAQAWALVFYLHQDHREAFDAYLRGLRRLTPGEFVTRQRALSDFQDAFGAPDVEFERDWIDRTLHLRLDRTEAGR